MAVFEFARLLIYAAIIGNALNTSKRAAFLLCRWSFLQINNQERQDPSTRGSGPGTCFIVQKSISERHLPSSPVICLSSDDLLNNAALPQGTETGRYQEDGKNWAETLRLG